MKRTILRNVNGMEGSEGKCGETRVVVAQVREMGDLNGGRGVCSRAYMRSEQKGRLVTHSK